MARRLLLITFAASVGVGLFAAPAGAGGGCHEVSGAVTSAAASRQVTVPMEKCAYGPTVLYVDPGTEVTWINNDPVPHTVSGAQLSWGSADLIEARESASYRFDEVGIYPYHCTLHPGMTGAIVVGDVGDAKEAVTREIDRQPQPISGDTDVEAPATDSTTGQGISPAAGAGIAAMSLGAGFGAALVFHRRRGATFESES